MVEHNLAKVGVASSSLVSRSIEVRLDFLVPRRIHIVFFKLWCYDKDHILIIERQAGWQSGYAAACKAVYAGSIPTPASKICMI